MAVSRCCQKLVCHGTVTAMTDKKPNAGQLVTIARAAEHAGVTERTIYRWVDEHDMPRYANDLGHVRIDLADLYYVMYLRRKRHDNYRKV